MTDRQLIEKAKEIIERIIYLSLATVGKDGMAWSSPVYAAYDEQYNFYWASGKNSRHSTNIAFNHTVSFTIFDSTAPWGTGEGVYFQAKVFELTDKEEIQKAFTYRYGRINKQFEPVENYMGNAPRRIYKAVPEKVWMNVDSEENGFFVDIRKEIKLK